MNRKRDLIIFAIFAALIVGIMLGAKGQQAIHSRNCPVAPVTVATILTKEDSLKAYTLRCSVDSIFVYDDNKRIGATLWGEDGVDSILTNYNE